MSSSLGGSIAGAMAQAAQAAAVNESFHSARSSIAENNEKAHGWAAYCAQLEEKSAEVSALIAHEGKVRVALSLQLEAINSEISSISELISKKSMIEVRDTSKVRIDNLNKRLRQLEKALQHSSADHESLKFVFDSHKVIVEKMDLGEKLPDDLMKIAENAWFEFMGGGRLSINPKIERSIDPPSI